MDLGRVVDVDAVTVAEDGQGQAQADDRLGRGQHEDDQGGGLAVDQPADAGG